MEKKSSRTAPNLDTQHRMMKFNNEHSLSFKKAVLFKGIIHGDLSHIPDTNVSSFEGNGVVVHYLNPHIDALITERNAMHGERLENESLNDEGHITFRKLVVAGHCTHKNSPHRVNKLIATTPQPNWMKQKAYDLLVDYCVGAYASTTDGAEINSRVSNSLTDMMSYALAVIEYNHNMKRDVGRNELLEIIMKNESVFIDPFKPSILNTVAVILQNLTPVTNRKK
jgi:hypothetical protein